MDDFSRRKFCKNVLAVPLIVSGSVVLGQYGNNRKDVESSLKLSDSEQITSHLQKGENNVKKVGIIICDRWNTCSGGKCLRSLRNREGGFERYKNEEVELVGYTTCGGCPGGNVEYAPEEMKKNGAEIVHLATGFIVGYPPCPYIEHFSKFIPEKYDMEVVIGTHPIPEKYYITHQNLKTWEAPEWKEYLKETLTDRETRLRYN